MGKRITFYLFIGALSVLDALLLRSPNLLGKIGLIMYHYDYLRTFPKALLTVSLVVGVGGVLAETIRFMVRRRKLKLFSGRVVLFLFAGLAIAILVKTVSDFTTWSYSHTGLRFQLGAFLLPSLLILIFLYTGLSLTANPGFPVSPMSEKNRNEFHADN